MPTEERYILESKVAADWMPVVTASIEELNWYSLPRTDAPGEVAYDDFHSAADALRDAIRTRAPWYEHRLRQLGTDRTFMRTDAKPYYLNEDELRAIVESLLIDAYKPRDRRTSKGSGWLTTDYLGWMVMKATTRLPDLSMLVARLELAGVVTSRIVWLDGSRYLCHSLTYEAKERIIGDPSAIDQIVKSTSRNLIDAWLVGSTADDGEGHLTFKVKS